MFFFSKDPQTHILGVPSVDMLDTVTLRGLLYNNGMIPLRYFFHLLVMIGLC